MSEELKPCPFCGGEAEHDTSKPITRCSNCGATTGWGGSEEARAERWNRRSVNHHANDIKDCPFCGARPILRGIPKHRFISCPSCGIYLYTRDPGYKTDVKAIEMWNRRYKDE